MTINCAMCDRPIGVEPVWCGRGRHDRLVCDPCGQREEKAQLLQFIDPRAFFEWKQSKAEGKVKVGRGVHTTSRNRHRSARASEPVRPRM